MIHTEHVQGRGMEIVNVNWLIDGFEAEVVGCAVGSAAFDTAASQ